MASELFKFLEQFMIDTFLIKLTQFDKNWTKKLLISLGTNFPEKTVKNHRDLYKSRNCLHQILTRYSRDSNPKHKGSKATALPLGYVRRNLKVVKIQLKK